MNTDKIIITLPYSPFSTCIKGSWNCTQNECQSTCHVYGEGHYRTFDGESYSFDGLCQYTFLEVYFIRFSALHNHSSYAHEYRGILFLKIRFMKRDLDVFLEGRVFSSVMLAPAILLTWRHGFMRCVTVGMLRDLCSRL